MEEIYVYGGYVLVAILLYLIMKTIFEQRSKEGFWGKDSEDKESKKLEETIKHIQESNTKLIQKMDLEKNRKYWEELIVAMEDRINTFSLQTVETIATMIKDDPENEKVIKTIGSLNELSKYKNTLKENMKYLDGLK